VSALTNRRLGAALRLVRPLPVLIFLAVAGGWYGLAYLHRGMDFVAKQIISENGEAMLGGSRFPYRSPLYYLGPLVVGGLPWTLVLPWALARGWRSGELPRRHAVAWAGVVFLFFSLAPLKRAAYLLPLRPALALGGARWRGAALAMAASVACTAVFVYGLFVPARAAQKAVKPFAHAVRDRLRPGDPLALLASEEEIPFIFHVGRNVPVLAPAGARPPDVPAGYYVLDRARWRSWESPAGWEEVLASPHL